mgnify:CR=1 FL=1
MKKVERFKFTGKIDMNLIILTSVFFIHDFNVHNEVIGLTYHNQQERNTYLIEKSIVLNGNGMLVYKQLWAKTRGIVYNVF